MLSFLAVVGAGVAFQMGGLSLPVPTTVEEAFGRSFVVEPAPLVVVETIDGPIEVIRGEPGRVDCRVQARSQGLGRRAAEANLEKLGVRIDQQGDTVRVVVEADGRRALRKSSASVTLIVPEDASLRLATQNGRVQVRGVQGPIQARSSNGPIDVEGARGIVSLESSNGRISCRAEQAILALETANGAIDFQGSLASGLSALKTSNGRIVLRLPEDQHFHLDAHSGNGRVSSDFDLDTARRAVFVRDHGDDPAPGVIVKARSGNGSIRVLSQNEHH